MRLIPPVAAPLSALDIAQTVIARRRDAPGAFARAVAERLGRRHALLFGSGRAALASYLAAVARPGRDEVVVPAYTCWSVPAAVVRAGLRVRLVDVDPDTFAPTPGDLSRALTPRTAAVIVAHLLAPLAEARALSDLVKVHDRQIRVVEDAAQAWPAEVAPSVDAVLISFGRGKPLALGGGGALVSDDDALHAPSPLGGGLIAALGLAATSVLSSPAWYRIPESLPFLGIGSTVFDPTFDAGAPFRGWQARLGLRQLGDLPRHVGERTANARSLLDELEGAAGVRVPAPARAAGPLRLPLLVASRTMRDALLPRLRRCGVSASALYRDVLADIPELRPHLAGGVGDLPGGRALADRLITVPVYPGLRAAEQRAVAGAMLRCVRGLAA